MPEDYNELPPHFMQEIYERTNLKTVCNYILFGGDTETIDKTYNERLKEGNKKILQLLEKVCTDNAEYADAVDKLRIAFGGHVDVYTEIGAQIGARLSLQLFNNEMLKEK